MTSTDYDDPFYAIRYALDRHYEEAKRIRRLVLQLEETGVSRREIGRRIGVQATTLTHWVKLAKAERDESAPDPGTNYLQQSRR
jgi:transposase-like protein